MNRMIPIALICMVGTVVSSCHAAEPAGRAQPRTAPLPVKTSFEPEKTKVAILPIEDLREGKKGKIDDQLQLGYQALRDAFGTRGFSLIPSRQIPAATPRLNGKNGDEVATALKADLVIDCGLRELRGEINAFGRKYSSAIVRLIVHSVQDGCLINEEFVSAHKGGYDVLATGDRGGERNAELLKVIDLALQSLLKPYPTLAEKAAASSKAAQSGQEKPQPSTDQ